MFSIGEFSRITGLTVKTLRFYHDQGILEPSRVETGSGYRFYAEAKIENARVIHALRDLGFTIADIKEILNSHDDDADLITILESRRADIQTQIRAERRTIRQLDSIISREREAIEMHTNEFQIERKTVDPILVASIHMQGKYSDCGKGFGKISRKFGRHISGKALLLCHDTEYRDDASFDVAMPIKRGKGHGRDTGRDTPWRRMSLPYASWPVRGITTFVPADIELCEGSRTRISVTDTRSLPQGAWHHLPRQPQELPHRDSADTEDSQCMNDKGDVGILRCCHNSAQNKRKPDGNLHEPHGRGFRFATASANRLPRCRYPAES